MKQTIKKKMRNPGKDIIRNQGEGGGRVKSAAAINKGRKYLGTDKINVCLVDAVKSGNMERVDQLVQKADGNVNMRMKDGRTLLMLACAGGHFELIKQLVNVYKVDTNRKDFKHQTALMFAARYGHFQCMKWLIENGNVKVQLKDFDGITCLLNAVVGGHLNCFQWLVVASRKRRRVMLREQNKVLRKIK